MGIGQSRKHIFKSKTGEILPHKKPLISGLICVPTITTEEFNVTMMGVMIFNVEPGPRDLF
jgi:hypothetical protein